MTDLLDEHGPGVNTMMLTADLEETSRDIKGRAGYGDVEIFDIPQGEGAGRVQAVYQVWPHPSSGAATTFLSALTALRIMV